MLGYFGNDENDKLACSDYRLPCSYTNGIYKELRTDIEMHNENTCFYVAITSYLIWDMFIYKY